MSSSRHFIISIVILVFICSVLGAEVTKKKRTLQEMVVHYTSPCEEIFRVSHGGYAYSLKHLKHHALDECDRQYRSKWLEAVDKAKECAQRSHRFTRSVVLEKIAGIATNIIGHVVTNLITSKLQPNSISSRDDRMRFFYKDFDMDNIYKDTSSSYVDICSPAGNHHREELENQAQSLAPLVWSVSKVHGEILANTANLNTITAYCRMGKMATTELGELMGSKEVGHIPMDSTEIVSVENGPDENSLSFLFWVESDEPYKETNVMLILLYAFAVSTFLCISFVIKVVLEKKRSNRARQTNVSVAARPL